MFRLTNICKQSPVLHSKTDKPLLSYGYLPRNVSFKVKPAEDRIWREYRRGVLKVVLECKKENKIKLFEERRQKKLYEEKFSFENLFGAAFKYAEEVNHKQQEKREKAELERRAEAKQTEEKDKIIQEIAHTEKEQNIKNILKEETQKMESFITKTNIEHSIEYALDNPISYNFAFPYTKVIGDGRGQKNFDQKGEVILHDIIPDVD
ncbi:hypothetical protein LOD99_2995 [Oopsacas minuta]|uniref:Small ribosomal subunit protein mS26 n=1 Tax=Oopsacas minuta TaxID=111878 RepID=A0AAV7JZB1_9METZ|nr:hypothetical protein LOD99_2995 [Oopsacas minuta]